MTIIYFLIFCSVLIALGFLAAFFWSVKTGQNDDMHTPAIRMLFDDEVKKQDHVEEKIKTNS
ncbi:cbb3-type cytochrome oxidase assembly protein CcoS [Pedobacter sp. MC2016-05]|uniref:cbb3-type cytochrome oxidase assembly protein CcoS n=1 Tax=Pedobacter sp. MC2016-05 TaxID=2994474 RepID=UPI0022483030|nr:cbb3-type cytochrome oxidase assembly protein CcoS [Pedobacter sp. MC2016-05]MCX2477235.1 cbb3-type cytochrome oxidase assembly protein CcoS [Pedobacter sp. MC2016-05]